MDRHLFVELMDFTDGWRDQDVHSIVSMGMGPHSTLVALTGYAKATGRWEELLESGVGVKDSYFNSRFWGLVYAKLNKLKEVISTGTVSLIIHTFRETPYQNVEERLVPALRYATAMYATRCRGEHRIRGNNRRGVRSVDIWGREAILRLRIIKIYGKVCQGGLRGAMESLNSTGAEKVLVDYYIRKGIHIGT